jgi:hypothetical protein
MAIATEPQETRRAARLPLSGLSEWQSRPDDPDEYREWWQHRADVLTDFMRPAVAGLRARPPHVLREL